MEQRENEIMILVNMIKQVRTREQPSLALVYAHGRSYRPDSLRTLCLGIQGKGGKQVGAMPAHAKNALKQQIQEVSYSPQDD